MPRFQFYFRQARVIVGDLSYFQRYSPTRFDGHIIFTNLTSPDDVKFFEKRGVACLVSLTPVIEGQFLPLPVLEAALNVAKLAEEDLPIEDDLLNRLHALELSPQVFDFAEPEEELMLTEEPLSAGHLPDESEGARLELSPSGEVSRFCFVIHPLHFDHIKRLKSVRTLSRFVPQRLLEDAAAQLPPWPVAKLSNLRGADGAVAEGLIYAVPMTSKAILRFPPSFLYKKLAQVAEDAARRGCRLMGLGAYTSVVGDAGLTVSRMVSIGVTTGNSYTVAATMHTLERAAEACSIELAGARALVVGATGSIGSVCARMLARKVASLDLVSPRPEKLLGLSRLMERESPQLKGRLRVSRKVTDFLASADIVISTTSAVDAVIDVSSLRPGTLVLDVARPPDIKEEHALRRSDILVIESGEILLPPDAELNYDLGLPAGTIYACLAETALLALDRRFEHFTIGREIDPAKVDLIDSIGSKHGFELAPIRSFGRVVTADAVAAVAAARAARAPLAPVVTD
jgi:predicted amino acid dehydrogenase